MKLPTVFKGAVGGTVLGVIIVALGVRYFGDQPFIEDVKYGLKGDVKGLFK